MTSDTRAQHPKFTDNAAIPKLPLPTPIHVGSSSTADFGVPSNVRIVISDRNTRKSLNEKFNYLGCCRASVTPQSDFKCLKTFAPDTIPNLGPGSISFATQLTGLGNGIRAASNKLSYNLLWYYARIVVIQMICVHFISVSLSLAKGLTLSRGIGSNVAATAVTVTDLYC
ncbi:hypothetical protein MRB53_006220 [Persea americana]|uniref:Uncharacterized protein n=1 Tax=Persea americana TaxID=3435 RepID=A0ACC2MFD2_PERAE|nr:hypothetical protein MRB53_006220 [Persea americana]